MSHELPFLGIYQHTVVLSRSYYATQDPRRTVPLLSSSAEDIELDLRQAVTQSRFVTLNLHDMQQPALDPGLLQITGSVHAMLKQKVDHSAQMFRLRHDLVDIFVPKDLQLRVNLTVSYELPGSTLRIYASSTSTPNASSTSTIWLDFETMRWEHNVRQAKPLVFVPSAEKDVFILGYMVAGSLGSPIARECLVLLDPDQNEKAKAPGTGAACQSCFKQFTCLAGSTSAA